MNAADLAELCASALPDEDLTAEDLETCCFGPGAEIVAADDGAAAVVYVVREFDHAGGPGSSVKVAWLLLVVVAPGARRTGQARALVGKVVEWCQDDGVVELHTGNAAPRYLWAGVDLSNAAALAFFQDLGFEPYDHALNMLTPHVVPRCRSRRASDRPRGRRRRRRRSRAASSRTGRTRCAAAPTAGRRSRRAMRRARPSHSPATP